MDLPILVLVQDDRERFDRYDQMLFDRSVDWIFPFKPASYFLLDF